MTSVNAGQWSGWNSGGASGKIVYCYYRAGDIYHCLMELSELTNSYTYAVEKGGHTILQEVVWPGCCKGLTVCPMPSHIPPMNPCREGLRLGAIQLADAVFSKFMESQGTLP